MMLNKHYLRFKDKKRMTRFFGLINHRKRLPGAGFAPTVLNNLAAVEEFLAARLPCVGIVDSNVPSTNIMIPVPGNDDSAICINFYCYILSRSLLSGKLNFVFL
jgi:ribosomal protein S2